MKSIILTSGPIFSIKNENGDRKAIKLENEELVNVLKNGIEKYDNLLFICSSPDDYKKNDEYAKIITKSLSLSGLKFNMSDIIDSRNWLFSKGLVGNSDLIILLGGNPIEQMDFFNSIELKEKLKKYKGCLMGVSAGSINLANQVYCSKDDEIENSTYYRGLGFTDINIEPHFDIKDTTRIDDILLNDSKKRPFVALPDDSFIVIKKEDISLNGDGYYFSEGAYQKINGNINELYRGNK
jgi:peptidase E